MTDERPGDLSRLNAWAGNFVSVLATLLLVILAVAVAGLALYTLVHDWRATGALDLAINQVMTYALLLLIIGELLVTVSQKANLVRELLDFLVIGVTTLVRHGLQLVLNSHAGGGRDVTPDLLINAGAILLLTVAFLAVRWVEAKLYPPAAKPPVREEFAE